MGKSQALDTIWEASDHLWEQIRPVILELDPPKITDRNKVDPQQMLNGIFFGCGAAASGPPAQGFGR